MTGDQQKAFETARALFGDQGVSWDEGYLVVRAGDEVVPELVRRLVADGVAVRAVVPAVEQGLEDFFLELTRAPTSTPGGGSGRRRMPPAAPPSASRGARRPCAASDASSSRSSSSGVPTSAGRACWRCPC